MNPKLILFPALAQVVLIFIIWVQMLNERIGLIVRRRIKLQLLNDSTKFQELMKDGERSTDSFENQFEVPLLLFFAVILIYILNLADEFYVGLAWVFVVLRAVQALIHCTYNRVKHRFAAYFFSSLVVWAIWIRLGYQIIKT